MKVTGLQYDIFWKNKAENFAQIQRLLEHEVADLFVLPEMFSTGFCMDAEEIADENEEALSFLKKIANEKKAAFCGSVSVKERGQFFNRMYFVKPDGSYDFYDKRHLFSFSGEDEIYTRGNVRKITEYQGFRILLQVCYDLRFPVFSRNRDDYDVILYVANWPEKRIDAWSHLLKARAIENLAYVFGVNRTGKDGNDLDYPESSAAYFADGTTVDFQKKNIISADFSLSALQEFREHFQFLNDRDEFDLSL